MNDTQPRSGITWTMSPAQQVALAMQHRPAREVAAAADQRQPVAERSVSPDQNRASGRRASPTRDRRRAAAPGSRSDAPTRPSSSSSAGARSRSRARPPRDSIAAPVSSSSSVTQSHSTLAAPCGTSSARWPIANLGSRADADRARPRRGSRWCVGAQRLERGPLLPVDGHVLARVLADRARVPRPAELHPARHADRWRHGPIVSRWVP